MSEEDIQRTLVAEFPSLNFGIDALGAVSVVVPTGYTNLSTTNLGLFVFETSIDLSGYALQNKTFYPYSSFEQRAAEVSASFTGVGPAPTAIFARNVIDITIVSSIPLDVSAPSMINIIGQLPGFTNLDPFGAGTYRINRDPLIHQRKLIYSYDSTIAGTTGSSVYRISSDTSASSLEPTAADKLYCYRIISSNAKVGVAFLPAARILMPGTIATEPTLEYMMRLKRSYELANQV